MPSGRIQYHTGGLDVASCVVTLAHAAIKGDFKVGSPINPLFAALKKARAERESGGNDTDNGIAHSLYQRWAADQGFGGGGFGGGFR